jgi:hypothetical protein
MRYVDDEVQTNDTLGKSLVVVSFSSAVCEACFEIMIHCEMQLRCTRRVIIIVCGWQKCTLAAFPMQSRRREMHRRRTENHARIEHNYYISFYIFIHYTSTCLFLLNLHAARIQVEA